MIELIMPRSFTLKIKYIFFILFMQKEYLTKFMLKADSP